MGQNPNRTPSEHPNPTTQIGSEMGGEFTYPTIHPLKWVLEWVVHRKPQNRIPLVLTHSHVSVSNMRAGEGLKRKRAFTSMDESLRILGAPSDGHRLFPTSPQGFATGICSTSCSSYAAAEASTEPVRGEPPTKTSSHLD